MNKFENWCNTTHYPYKNTGNLLRQLAYVMLIGGIIATFLIGFSVSYTPPSQKYVSGTYIGKTYYSGYYEDVPAKFDFNLFITYVLIGVPSAFASGLVLHAMGDVVYSVMKTAGTLPEATTVQQTLEKAAKAATWACSECKTENRMADAYCVQCGACKPRSGASANTNTWLCPECKTSNGVFKGVCTECGARKSHA